MTIQPKINEFVFNHDGTDASEFIEIIGDPNTDYSNLWVLVIEGDSTGAGTIDDVFQVGTTNADGLWTTGFFGNELENGTQTVLLVENFTGAQGDDLDTDNDGTPDSAPYSNLLDSVAVTDGGGSDQTYSPVVLDSNFDGNGNTVGGASRIPNGTDTDTVGDWVRNDFEGQGLPGLSGTVGANEALNTPGEENSTTAPPPPTPTLLSIMQIQGAGHRSPFEGQLVITTGIVTVLESNGFYMQDPNGDGDDATSDGIFVFTNSAPTVAVGDFAAVSGTVNEFVSASRPNDLTVTQISADTVAPAGSGLPLPDATILGEGGRMPPNQIVEDDAFGSFDPENDGIDFYESLEGMLVTVPDAVAVSASNRFGETWVVADDGDNATSLNDRGGITLAEDDINPERIQLQVDSTLTPGFTATADVGDGLGDVTGVVDYSFGNFEVKILDPLTITDGGLEDETSELVGTDDQMTVATYNILNVSAAGGADDAQIAELAQQIVNNLNGPDVIALQEVQDDSGTADDGTVTADATLQAIVDAIAAAGGPTYTFFDVDPVDNTQGGVPGGNIRVAYLYNDARVDLVPGSVKALDALPGFEPDVGVRVPLEAQFEFNGETVTLINNHLSSKFGSSPVYGSVQPFINAGDAERTAQAAALNDYVDALVDADPDAKVVVLGDLNDFEFSDPIRTLKGTGSDQVLFNQIDTVPASEDGYTFNFEGNSQVLDHIMVTDALRDRVEFDIVHQNVDFGDAGSSNPAVVGEAASDHEPLLARIDFSDIEAPPEANDMVAIRKLATIDTGLGEDGAETVAFDEGTDQLFVTNAGDKSFDIIDISDPETPVDVKRVDVSDLGTPTQVASKNGVIAVSIETEVNPADFDPMLIGENGFQAHQILTIGETLTETTGALNGNTAGDYQPVGILDGIGGYELDENTVRIFVNHEQSDGNGSPYEVNGLELQGARISYFDIDKATLSIVDGGVAFNQIIDRAGNPVESVDQLDNGAHGFDRFCSAALFEAGQFDGRGLVDRIFFAGEETSTDFGSPHGGAEWALDVATGTLYDVPAMGRGTWENVTEVDTGVEDKVAFVMGDDKEGAPLYLYVGNKDMTEGAGFLERNGLADGQMYVWVPNKGEEDPSDFNTSGKIKGKWEPIEVQNLSMAGQPGYDEFGYKDDTTLRNEAIINFGAFQFSRPEDVSTNPEDGQQLVFASTGRGGFAEDADEVGTLYTIDLKFNNKGVPKNAKVEILYDGDADPFQQLRSPDNLDWADDGFIYVQEDRANSGLFGDDAANVNEASILRIDPETGFVTRVAEIDRSAVPPGQFDTDPDDVGDWESSGILDVSELFGYEGGSLFIATVQAHSVRGGVIGTSDDLREGGQLLFLTAPGVDAEVGQAGFGAGREYPNVGDGLVAFFDANGNIISTVDVGNLPDNLAFTPDGMKIVVANEGEAPDGSLFDPEGSVSIIDISNGVANATVQTVDFTGLDGMEQELREQGVRLFDGKSVSEDVEPEYVAISPDGTQAFVTLQEANSVAIIDIETATLVGIKSLGAKDHSLPGNLLDPSDRDGENDLDKAPVYGLYMPDQIASFVINGETYYITANEGDARDEDVRIKDLDLDPTAYPDAEFLQQDEELGRLQASSIDGDTDGDGDIDQLFVYGARSFSIWDDSGEQVFDSGDEFARILFDVLTPDQLDSLDGRSDNKGAEPEGVTTGMVGEDVYAFIGLERANGVMVYKISDPTAPEFVKFLQTDGDVGPEGMTFIPADESPNGEALLAVANEVSGTTTLYEITEDNGSSGPDTFKLQILHASDLEGGVNAIGRAANFAAIVDFLEDTHENSITLSAGDNYIPGPFFSASDDRATFRDGDVFNDFYNDFFDLPGTVGEIYEGLREGGGRVDISIMNAIGFDASALGNHEFDLGTAQLESIIAPDFRGAGLADDRWVGAQFPYLSANLDFSGDDDLSGLFTPDILPSTDFVTGPEQSLAGASVPKIAPATVVEEGGERIGIVGATTPLLASISSPGGVTTIGPNTNDMAALAAVLQPVIDALINDGINKIVLVSHLQQIALETELAGLLSGVDVIIAGGSDTLLADSEDVARGLNPGDTPDDDYPVNATDANGDPVVIVSTDGEYSYVGRLVVEFDADGKIILDDGGNATDEDVSGAFATTTEQVEALYGDDDPFAEGTKGAKVQGLVGAVEGVVNAQDGNTFGLTDVFLDGRRSEVRTEETNLGNITADANLAAAQQHDSTVMVSIKNGGGIRAPIGETDGAGNLLPPQFNPISGKLEGQVSQLDISNALRFNNGLTLITLTAAQLKEVLEHAVAATALGATPGQFAQVGGIKFSFDASQTARTFDANTNAQVTAGERVQNVVIETDSGPVVVIENGEVVPDAPAEIRVVTLDFLAGGGDNYPFNFFASQDPTFANVVNLEDVLPAGGAATFAAAGSEQDALAEYLTANFAVTPFNEAETDPSGDERVQNLAFRDDTVLDGTEEPEPIIGDGGRNTLVGTEEADIIFGLGNRDTLIGLAGDDELNGGNGRDTILGGEGEDEIDGGRGRDNLFGGEDADTFILGPDSGRDTIFDFNPGEDMLSLQGTSFADVDEVLDATEEFGAGVRIDLSDVTNARVTILGIDKDDLSDANISLVV